MGDNEVNSYPTLQKFINPDEKIELFKVGHHGSYNSVDENMATLIKPEVSIISVGPNGYGHPHKKVLNHLKKSRIFRTDRDNSIKIKTNGENFAVYTYDYKKSCWRKNKN